MTTIFRNASVAIFMFGFAALLQASPTTYDFNFATPTGYAITDVVIYSANASDDDVFFAPDIPSGTQSLAYTAPFDPDRFLILGIHTDALGPHIAMFADPTFTTDVIGDMWRDHFTSPRHNAMLSLIPNAHDGDPAAIASLTDFFRGSEATAATFSSSTSYSVLQWSVAIAVPEPATLALLGLGLVGLGFSRRRTLN